MTTICRLHSKASTSSSQLLQRSKMQAEERGLDVEGVTQHNTTQHNTTQHMLIWIQLSHLETGVAVLGWHCWTHWCWEEQHPVCPLPPQPRPRSARTSICTCVCVCVCVCACACVCVCLLNSQFVDGPHLDPAQQAAILYVCVCACVCVCPAYLF